MQNVTNLDRSIRPGSLYSSPAVWKVIRSDSGRLAVTNVPDPDRPVIYRTTSYQEAFDFVEQRGGLEEAWRAFWRTVFVMTVILIGAALILEAQPAEAAETTIDWQAPTLNVDGSALTDLAGYLVFVGSSSRTYLEIIAVDDPSATRATVTFSANWLAPGENQVFIAMKALDERGNESAFSNEISKVITVEDDIAPGAPILITITIEIGIDCPAGVTCTVGSP